MSPMRAVQGMEFLRKRWTALCCFRRLLPACRGQNGSEVLFGKQFPLSGRFAILDQQPVQTRQQGSSLRRGLTGQHLVEERWPVVRGQGGAGLISRRSNRDFPVVQQIVRRKTGTAADDCAFPPTGPNEVHSLRRVCERDKSGRELSLRGGGHPAEQILGLSDFRWQSQAGTSAVDQCINRPRTAEYVQGGTNPGSSAGLE